MAQVVTSENIVEFIQTGKVAEFKPPEAAKPEGEAKPDAKPTDKPKDDAAQLQPRAADGTFQSPTGEKPTDKGQAAPQPADDDDPEDANLPERVKRQIGKKHRLMKEAEEFARERDREAAAEKSRADTLQREVEALRGKKSDGPKPDTQSGSDPDEPKPDDFKTVGEYTRALTKYEVAKAAKTAGEANKRQSEQERQQAQANEIATAFVQRREKFEEAHPDFEDVISKSPLIIADAGVQYIAESEIGPQLAYYLATPEGKEDADRLSRLSPTRCVAEIGKLEARFESAAKKDTKDPASQPTRQVSRAPAPIKPLSGDSATPVHKDPSQMSFQELRAHRLAERAAGKRV